MPTSKTNSPTVATKLIDRVMASIELDELATSLANRLGRKLLEATDTDTLVEKLFQKFQGEFQEALTTALLERL